MRVRRPKHDHLKRYTRFARSLRMMALPNWMLGSVLRRARWRDTLEVLLLRRRWK